MESFCVYYFPGKLINEEYKDYFKKVFTKWTTIYEGSWLSSQMTKFMAISMSYFRITRWYLAQNWSLPCQIRLPKWDSNFFYKSKKIIFEVPKIVFFVKQVPKIRLKIELLEFSHEMDHIGGLLPKDFEFLSFFAIFRWLNEFLEIYHK